MTDYPTLHLLIGGEKLGTDGRETRDVIDPATEETIGSLPCASSDDLDRALENADKGFKVWRNTPAPKRAKALQKAAQLLRERSDEIARILTREQGKPVPEGKGEVLYSANLFDFYAGECQRIYGRTLVRPDGQAARIEYEPVGPVAAFAPWNFPAINVARKVGGPLAAGCSVIVKPDEETPATGLAVCQALLDAGVPGEVCQVVFGVPDDISRHLLGSPIVKKLSFTGSTEVGKHLAKLAAEGLKKATMELGGHGPVLVFDDMDVDTVLDQMVPAKYRNAGQVCVSPTRFIVQDSIYEKFRDGFAARAKAIQVGNGFEDGTQMGPMANARRPDTIESMIADAKDKGAQLLAGGERIGNQGFFYAPSVLADLPLDAEIMNEEPFGPVALINRYADEDAMLEEANRLQYGLAAYAWTQDKARRQRVTRAIEAGMVALNTTGVSAVDAPFGGVKWSGYGSEDGSEGVMACMNLKSVHEVL